MSVLEGKVAIVTGAANGLGRAEAIYLGSLGARVVVSDIGANRDGEGRSSDAAEEVVEQIKSAGGEAVSHCGDVADWNDSQALIKTAVDTFGDLNILVNNAGFCRDRMLFSMSEEEFDSVIRVHLKGHFCTMRFASEYWRNKSKQTGEALYGRIISTSSEAFIFGSAGQPNYAAAKAGIVAMTMGAAQALEKYGITANVIMPRARTRMTDTGPVAAIFEKPEDGFDQFDPVHVGPLVAYLASPAASQVSGYVMIVWGNQIRMVERPNTDTIFETDGGWTTANVEEKLGPYFAEREPIWGGFTVPPS